MDTLFEPPYKEMEILCLPDSPFELLRRLGIINNATNPGLERAQRKLYGRRASQVTRYREPRLYVKVMHLESKPPSAKIATSGCWVLINKHLYSNLLMTLLDFFFFFFWFKSSLRLVNSSYTPTLCVL